MAAMALAKFNVIVSVQHIKAYQGEKKKTNQ